MKPKILYINTIGSMGGAEYSLLTLLSALKTSEYEPILLCPKESALEHKAIERNINTYSINFVTHQLAKNPLGFLLTIIKVLYFVYTLKPSILHGNGLRSLHYVVPAASLFKIPSVIHIRDIEIPPSRLARFLLKKATAQVVISRAVEQALREIDCLSKHCFVIHNAVHVTPYIEGAKTRINTRSSLNLNRDDIAIGLVGRLVQWKGQEFFIEAAHLLSQYQNVKWYIVGGVWKEASYDGEAYLDALNKLIERYVLQEKVFILGERFDIPALMNSFDIIVVPSILPEPFGRVAIEAMAASKPVIASNEGGLAEIIDHQIDGYLIKPRDAKAIADAVQSLIEDNTARITIGQEAFTKVLTKFSDSVHAQNIAEVYGFLLSR